jgi:hypothetical protein
MLAARWFVNPAFTQGRKAPNVGDGGAQACFAGRPEEVLSPNKMNQLETSPPAEVPGWSLSRGSRFVHEVMERIEPSFHAWAYDLAAGSRSEIVSMTRLLKNRT